MEFIDEAIKIATRSSLMRHRTGAVIVRDGKIISNGWSHIPATRVLTSRRSLHAELHALSRTRHRININGATCYIATLSRADNRVNSWPCLHCAIALRAAGILRVCFTTYTGHFSIGLADIVFEGLKVYEPNRD